MVISTNRILPYLELSARQGYLAGMTPEQPTNAINPPTASRSQGVCHDGRIDLRAAYESYLAPNHSEGTRAIRRHALRKWEEFLAVTYSSSQFTYSSATTVGKSSPTVCDILTQDLNDDLMLAWREWRLEQLRNAPAKANVRSNPGATLRKEWDALHQILARLGPRGPGNPKGRGLIPIVPSIDLPDVADHENGLLGESDVLAIWEAAAFAQWPRVLFADPPSIWRAVISLALTYGVGFAELAAFRSDWIKPCGKTPEKNGIATCPNGWLCFARTKTAKRLVLPMSHEVMKRLMLIQSEEWSLGIEVKNKATFYDCFSEITVRAGCPGIKFGAFRKTCNDIWNAHEAIPRSEGIGGYGRWILGHKSRDVNDSSYASVQHHIAKAIDRFPYPWYAGVERGNYALDVEALPSKKASDSGNGVVVSRVRGPRNA